MKIYTYIKKCNKKQLAELFASGWWTDVEAEVVFKHSSIEEYAEEMAKHVFNRQIPEVIRFNGMKWIDTKTKKVKQL